jgi:hypothetical protein
MGVKQLVLIFKKISIMAVTLPTGGTAFFIKQGELMEKLEPHFMEWSIDLTFINDVLKPSRIKYEHLYALCEDPLTRTEELVILKNEAYKVYRKNLAHLIEIVKAVSGLTEEQLKAYGIAAGKAGGAHVKNPPKETPDLTFDLNTPREVRFIWGSRPKDVLYIELLFKLGGEKPTRIEDFDESATATTSPYVRKHNEDQRFKPLHVLARFVSKTGVPGSWTVIYTVVVP